MLRAIALDDCRDWSDSRTKGTYLDSRQEDPILSSEYKTGQNVQRLVDRMPATARAFLWQCAPFLSGPICLLEDEAQNSTPIIGSDGIRVHGLSIVQAAICRMGTDVVDHIARLASQDGNGLAVVRNMRLGFFPLHLLEGYYCEGSLKIAQLRGWSEITIDLDEHAVRARERLKQQLKFARQLPSTTITFTGWSLLALEALMFLELPPDILSNCVELDFYFKSPYGPKVPVVRVDSMTVDTTLSQLPLARRPMPMLSPLGLLISYARRLRSLTINMASPIEFGFYQREHAARHMYLRDAPLLNQFRLRGNIDASLFAIPLWSNLRHLDLEGEISANEIVEISIGCPLLLSATLFLDEETVASAPPLFAHLETIAATSTAQLELLTSNGATPRLKKVMIICSKLDQTVVGTAFASDTIKFLGPHHSIRPDLVASQLYDILVARQAIAGASLLTLLIEDFSADDLDRFGEAWLQTMRYAPVAGIVVVDCTVCSMAAVSLATLARGLVEPGGFLEFRTCEGTADPLGCTWEDTVGGSVMAMLADADIDVFIS